jgi:hypothetical protein
LPNKLFEKESKYSGFQAEKIEKNKSTFYIVFHSQPYKYNSLILGYFVSFILMVGPQIKQIFEAMF